MLVADKRHCLAFLEPLIEGNVLADFGFLSPTNLSNLGLYTSDSDETLPWEGSSTSLSALMMYWYEARLG